jgi:transcriptional regulator with XRE-family HTH domain
MEQIRYLMNHYELSATQLADKLGIQRSTISHLLSGRNNPSIDLLRRIISNFTNINEAWLLSGHGSPLKSAKESSSDLKSVNNEQTTIATFVNDSTNHVNDTFVTKETVSDTDVNSIKSVKDKVPFVNNEDIEQILVFYTDGTFKYFRPRE